jgi:hypothetical protein
LILEFNDYVAIKRFIIFHEKIAEAIQIGSMAELYSTKSDWDQVLSKYIKQYEKREAKRIERLKKKRDQQLQKERDNQIAREAARQETVQMFDPDSDMN